MILCCGEALIDMLPRTSTDGEYCFAPHAGGAVFNTSIALGRLGVETQLFTGLSSDMFGNMLRAGLIASNVQHEQSVTSDRPTTLAFVKLVDGHAEYAFNDENTAGRMLTSDSLPDVNADALFFGGISLAVEPCANAYEQLMLREAPYRLSMIDPNIRPTFINDEDRFRSRITRMMEAADVVKTSDEDLFWILGQDDPAALFDGTKTQVVLLTRGSDGVSLFTRNERIDIAATKADVVDTVGAGDTFNAGFLASLSDQGCLSKDALLSADLSEAAKLGARTAAITVSRAGANPPWRNEL